MANKRMTKSRVDFFKRRRADKEAGIVRYTPQDFADILSSDGNYRGRTSVTLRTDEQIAEAKHPSRVSERGAETGSTDAQGFFIKTIRGR